MPTIAFGIWPLFSFVERSFTTPPFFCVTVTSPGVHVTTPPMHTFCVLPVLRPLLTTGRSSHAPLMNRSSASLNELVPAQLRHSGS
jgi:hypothetical protein